jgi:hypothetical protein
MGKMKSKAPDLAHITVDIASIQRVNEQVADQASALRDLIKSKAEARGYNTVALGMLRRVAAMSDEKFADFWRTFEGGLQQVVAERQGQLSGELDLDQGEVVPFGEAAAE